MDTKIDDYSFKCAAHKTKFKNDCKYFNEKFLQLNCKIKEIPVSVSPDYYTRCE